MDGASKFVRGDAIAGLLVVFINIIGGMIIGIAQQGMSFADAARTYTLLTVGDGLVTQVPALIVSTAAGLLVSKAGLSGAADKALLRQLSGYPQGARHVGRRDADAWRCCRAFRCLPFLLLGGGACGARLTCSTSARKDAAAAADKAAAGWLPPAAARKSRSPTALKIDDLKIELGYALLPLVNWPDGTDRLTEQIKALRRSLAIEMGFVMPAVRILDNVQLEANAYVIKVKEVDAGTGGDLAEPVHGAWIPPAAQVDAARHPHHRADLRPAGNLGRCRALKEEAALKGYTVVDAATVLVDASHRAAQGQHVGPAVLRARCRSC